MGQVEGIINGDELVRWLINVQEVQWVFTPFDVCWEGWSMDGYALDAEKSIHKSSIMEMDGHRGTSSLLVQGSFTDRDIGETTAYWFGGPLLTVI